MLERPNAAIRPQKFKQQVSTSENQDSLTEGTSNQNTTPSILKKVIELPKPQFQCADVTTTRRFIISKPPNSFDGSQQTICNGNPTLVWAQQMEKTKTVLYNKMHLIRKTLPQNQIDYTQDFHTTFRPLPQNM